MKADSPVVTYIYEAVNYGGSNDPNVVVVHDVESPLKKGYARSLIGPAWFGGPAGTSTHYLVGPDDICQGVPENRIAWHCGTGNRGTLAIEQCGYARFSRAEWDTPDGLIQQENVSKLLADINRRRPLIRLRTLSDSELLYAWRNPGTPGGVSTHNQMRRVIKGTNHHDPYNSEDSDVAYPLVRVINRAIAIRNGVDLDEDDMPLSEDDVRRIADAVLNRRHEVLGNQTIVEAVANTKNDVGGLLNGRPDELAVGEGNAQTRTQALAQVRNDVSAIKAALDEAPKA